MTQKGYEVLKAILENNVHKYISEVIVGRDRNIENDFAEEIILLCQQSKIRYFERNEDFEVLSNYSIAISWRWLIQENNSKLIILHDSLLPKYRGFAPLVNMLINGEPEIGVSAIFASREYDRGDIIQQSSIKINYPIKISDAITLVSEIYIKLVMNIFRKISCDEELHAIKQNEEQASYSLWRDEHDYLIDWSKNANDILRFIDAVSSPYKGAATYINGKQKIRILEAEIENDVKIVNRDTGKVIFVKDKFPIIVCGSGLLKLKKAINDKTTESVIPFKNFRIRLTRYEIQ